VGKGDTGTDNNSTNEGQDSIKWMIIAPLRTKDVTEVPCDLQSASKSSSSAQFVILGFGLRNWSKGSVVPFLEDMLSCPGDRPTLKGSGSAQYLSRKAVDRRGKKGVIS